MPYETHWVEPALFLEHASIKIWRTYKDDDIEQGHRTYSFTRSERCGDYSCDCPGGGCSNVFDVRDLPNWVDERPPFIQSGLAVEDVARLEAAWKKYQVTEDDRIRQAIRAAIEAAHLAKPGVA
jgi:hypothetical protein